MNFREFFTKTIKAEQQILRPYFFADDMADPAKLETEETYFRLRLTRMFLQHQREWFKSKYPIVHTLVRFAGLDGTVETHFIAKPEMAAGEETGSLDQIVTLDKTVLGPILYRGGDLGLLLGLYSAPADDWAQRFLDLAEGVSKFIPAAPAVLQQGLTITNTVKKAVEGMLTGDGVSLKLGLDKELKENEWLAPGYLVMIAAPDDEIDQAALVVEDGELLTRQGRIYNAHDYIVLAIEVTDSRSDWQSLGYGHLWQSLLKTAGEADDVAQVKQAYIMFSGAVMGSSDLSWRDRNAIVKLAQKRVKAIRDARAGDGFLEGLKGVKVDDAFEQMLHVDEDALYDVMDEGVEDSSELLATDWIG